MRLKSFFGVLLCFCLVLCSFCDIYADDGSDSRTRCGYSDHSVLFFCMDDVADVPVSDNSVSFRRILHHKSDLLQYDDNDVVYEKIQAADLDGMSEQEVIDKVAPLFVKDCKDTGVPASVSLAQFIVESGYGHSELAVSANNIFGMKTELSENTWDGSVWDGDIYTKETSEQMAGGQYVTIVADFRRYDTINDCIVDHSAYLSNSEHDGHLRYDGIVGCDDYVKAVDIVAKGGYASSQTYRDKLIDEIETYDLTQYDVGLDGDDSVSFNQSASRKGKIIVIDAGHQAKGNPEKEPIGPGASQTKAKVAGGTKGVSTGIPEYQLTLDISLKLRDELEYRGYDVLMVRESNNVNISNAERAKFANENNADAFLRIHANGSNDPSVNGAMTICQTRSNPYNGDLYDKSYKLSECVLDGLCDVSGIKKMKVWQTDTMSGINWCTVPVSIVEVGYMTNPEEDEMLNNPDYQDRIVFGIADGVDAYFGE